MLNDRFWPKADRLLKASFDPLQTLAMSQCHPHGRHLLHRSLDLLERLCDKRNVVKGLACDCVGNRTHVARI